MSHNLNSTISVIDIDIGKNSFDVVGLDDRDLELACGRHLELFARLLDRVGLVGGHDRAEV